MKRLLIGAVIALAILGIAIVGWGLTGSTVRGEVVRERDGKPAQDVEVQIDGKTVELQDGRFDLKLPLGTHAVTVSAPGYETVSMDVTLELFRSADLGSISLVNADLHVALIENYPGYPPVERAKLVIAGRSLEVTSSKTQLSDLPTGESVLTITADGHMETSITVNLSGGENSVVATLTPSLATVVERTAQSGIDKDLALTWATIHPARQKQWGTEAEYIKAMQKRDEESAELLINVVSFKVLTARHLPTHVDKPSQQTFTDVYAVPIAYRVSAPMLALLGQSEISMTHTDYWVLLDGMWRSLGDGEPVGD